ncbi:MAG: nucleotidyl transferase AbiEii/AbiGii toxin family protein [Anaerolineales bacterium]
MKSYLNNLVDGVPSPLQGRNLAREYLQARILGALQQAGAMVPLAFHGGTALRFLYALPRYSEDLDFALERSAGDYDFRDYLRTIQRRLTAENYEVTVKLNDRKVVHSAFVRFPGLLYELGLSPHPSEILAVKVEVDTRPPAGAGLSTTVIRRHVLLHLQHHDRATLFAGKLHALLQRNYVKGRDLYDLVWYLSDPNWPQPNLPFLNNALQQTGWTGERLTTTNWRAVVREYVAALDWAQVVADVRPFLERKVDTELLIREIAMELLDRKHS